jgi:hypothetical protein
MLRNSPTLYVEDRITQASPAAGRIVKRPGIKFGWGSCEVNGDTQGGTHEVTMIVCAGHACSAASCPRCNMI